MSTSKLARKLRIRALVGATWLLLASCGDDEAGEGGGAPSTTTATTATTASSASGTVGSSSASGSDGSGGAGGEEEMPDLPPGHVPCEEGELWPLALVSDRFPMQVHYRGPSEEDMAHEVLGHLETAWAIEVEELGFRPPLPDEGACGPDAAYDVFLYRGLEDAYVEALEENLATPWDDWTSHMVVDPWGPYGGEILGSTLAHELNHACQATDDWYDATFAYEMTATFIEEVMFDDVDVLAEISEDFQLHPDLALDYDDGYETWYMYAAALYFVYLREHYFEGDASFAADAWLGMRSEPDENEPDFADAIDELLAPHSSSYVDSVLELARWRWFTGSRDDGEHFEEGTAYAEVPSTTVNAETSVVELDPAPMITGSAYFRISPSDAPSMIDIEVDAPADPEVRWVGQLILAAEDDVHLVDLTVEGVTLVLGADEEWVLVVTAMPAGEFDLDERTDERRPATLRLTAVD